MTKSYRNDFSPTHKLRAVKDIDGIAKTNDILEVEVEYVLGGIITCYLPDLRRVNLFDNRLADHNVDLILE